LGNKTDRRNMLKLIAAALIGAVASAIKIPRAKAADGDPLLHNKLVFPYVGGSITLQDFEFLRGFMNNPEITS